MKKLSDIELELDVDFIGGQDPLTKEDENALSNFFKQRKDERGIVSKIRIKIPKRTKSNV